MFNLTDSDMDMGKAETVAFGATGEMPRIGDRPVIAFSAAALQAYAAVPESEGVAYWSITLEQAGELVRRVPERLLADEARDLAAGEAMVARAGALGLLPCPSPPTPRQGRRVAGPGVYSLATRARARGPR